MPVHAGPCGPFEPSQVHGGSSFPIVTPDEVSYVVIIFSIKIYMTCCLFVWCSGAGVILFVKFDLQPSRAHLLDFVSLGRITCSGEVEFDP